MRCTTILASFAIVCLLLVSSAVQAAGKPWRLGVHGGIMDQDVSGLDNAMNAGVGFGYDFGRFALEGMYSTSLSKGDARIGSLTGDWDVSVLAAYGVCRTLGQYYLKAKVGYLNEDVKISVSSASSSGSDSGASFGFGGGVRFGQGHSAELEYTVIEENINFISLAVWL